MRVPPPAVAEELTGWGRWPRCAARRYRPARAGAVGPHLAQAAESCWTLRGAGRAYGDAAIQDGAVLDLCGLDRLLVFDRAAGVLRAEAGVTLAEVLAVTVPAGWLPAVLPGTAQATLGGMTACDVHGKNHLTAGSWQDHTRRIALLDAHGSVRDLAPGDSLFAATCGGLGLTGVILEVEIGLEPIPSPWVLERVRAVVGIDALLGALAEVGADPRWPHAVAWLDGFEAPARARGLVHAGRIATPAECVGDPAPTSASPRVLPTRARRLPPAASWCLGPTLVRRFNAWHHARTLRAVGAADQAGGQRRVSLERFFFPLDRWRDWNRAYGARGFVQLQCLIPHAEAPSALKGLLAQLGDAGHPPYLVVMKQLGGPGHGYLSFPASGVTIALDLPRRPGLEAVLARLEPALLACGARVYLAKDAVLSREAFRAMYPAWQRFLAVRSEVDPEGRFTSALARRLGLATGAGADMS